MGDFILVHRTGYVGPFFCGGDEWGPDRSKAWHAPEKEARIRLERWDHGFGDQRKNVVLDEREHPEVEEALLQCFSGDFTKLQVIQKYREYAGMISLMYFVQRALLGDRVSFDRFSGGHFGQVLKAWEAKN